MISVIVPVYKTEKYLERCINSILNQTYKDIELILVDDGSPDKCPAICDTFAQMDERVKVIHKVNGGVSTARNTGLEIATGDYIAFVDSDDYIELDMYEKMLSKVAEYGCDVIMCDCMKDYPDHSIIYTHDIRGGFYSYEELLTEYYPHLLMMENVEYPATISNVTILWKNTLNTPDMRYEPGIRFSEDLLFGAKLLRNAKSFYYMKGEALYHYIFNERSASHTFVEDKWNDYVRLYNKIKLEFSDNKKFDFKSQIEKVLLFFIYNAVGDYMRNSTLSIREKKNKIQNILNDKNVKTLFKSLEIKSLQISTKQKLITYLYKNKIAIGLLCMYYSKK